jgi:hypothetical protein
VEYEVSVEFDSTVYMRVNADNEEEAQRLASSRFDPRDYMEQLIDGAWIVGDAEAVDGIEEEA